MPKVSVIIPVYNTEKYIERCAVSLFEQTLDDIQYIFVDDCSEDQSMNELYKVLERYPKRREQVTFCHHEKNLGLPAARRTGLAKAQGDYVIHCDSDDWVDKDAYRLMYEKALDEGDDIVSCGWYISNDNTILAESNDTYINPIPGGIVGDILTQRYSSWVWNKLVKRSLYDQILFFPTKNVLEDMCVVIQLYYYSAKPSILNQSLYYYYFNPNSITNKLETKEKILDFVQEMKENFECVRKFLQANSLQERFHYEIECYKYYIKNWMRYAVRNVSDIKLWQEVYPQLNNPFHRNPYFRSRDRFMALLLSLRIYPFIKALIRKY